MTVSRSRHGRPLTVLALSSLLLAGCSGGGQSAQDTADETSPEETAEPVAGGDAVFAIDTPVLGFDPNVRPAAQEARVMRQIFDSLLHLDDEGEVQPWLATGWEVSDDGLTYTFTVRDDVTFHDGTAFDAAAVCYNLDRIKDPASASIYAIGLIGPYESCEAPDATTAVVTLASPYAPFLNNLTSPFMGINSPTAAAAVPPADYMLEPVGSGPFEFASFIPNDRVVLESFDDYDWAPGNATHTGAAHLDTLTFQIIPDATVRMGSLRNGSVQGVGNVPETEVAAIEQDATLEFIARAQSGSPFQLHLNASRPPFDDPAVRAAARQAMDIDSAVEALYFGAYERAWGPLSPATFGYDEGVEGSSAFDPEAAAAALEEAGWVEGPDGVREKDGQRLEIRYVESTPNREKRQDIATFLEANLEDVGFDVEVAFEQAAPLQTTLQEGGYDIAGLSLVAVDPNVLYQVYDPRFIPAPGALGFNFSHTDSPELTELLAEGQMALDASEREAIYADVQADVVENARSVPVYVPTYTVALNGLQGLRFDAEGYPVFYDASLAE